MPKGRQAKRDEVVPESFLRRLRRDLAGFKSEQQDIQASLAALIWNCGSRRRQHREKAGAMSITYQEIARRFGRGGFSVINARLGIFDVTRQWSVHRNLTKAYTLKPAVAQVVADYLQKGRRRLTSLVSESGLRLRTLLKAVASKDMDGITARAWARAKPLNNVPVDVPMLKALKAELDAMQGPHTRNLFGNLPPDAVAYSRDMVAKILRMAKVDVSGEGYVMLRYVEATSGRLYARGINLQTVPSLIKQAALHGLLEYDFENCHYAIFQQMAARFGFQCPAIQNYLANKKATRSRIALDVGITEEQAKVCLLAIMYGARQSEWHENAIPQSIGKKAAALYQHPLFAGIAAEIEQGRKAIIAGWHRREKTLLNDAGKSISTKASDKQILAHLIQGVEARMLRAALDLYQPDIVLLQHDGFASTKQLDRALIEQAIQTATGYQIKVTEEGIEVEADFGASRHRNNE